MKNFFQNKNAGPVLFLTIYQIILFLLLPWYFYQTSPALSLWVVAAVLFCISGISITFGYHRLFAHRAFKTQPIVEVITLFFASLTFQGSCLRWAYEHRIHHAHVDTDEDPYSIKKGFLYAHCMWLINKPRPIETSVTADLQKNPRVMFQHKYSRTCMIGSNVLVVLLMGFYTGDWLGALVLPFGLRLFLNHHTTWFINSLAHTWGAREFCNELSAVDNYLISLVTFGEGYHNYHHTFAQDYRNGIKWYHFDPTKWLIWTLEKLGLASNLRRVDPFLVKKKIIKEKTLTVVDQLDERFTNYKKDLLELVDRMTSHLNDLSQLQKNFPRTKEFKEKVRAIQKDLKQEFKQWKLTLRFLQKSAQFASY